MVSHEGKPPQLNRNLLYLIKSCHILQNCLLLLKQGKKRQMLLRVINQMYHKVQKLFDIKSRHHHQMQEKLYRKISNPLVLRFLNKLLILYFLLTYVTDLLLKWAILLLIRRQLFCQAKHKLQPLSLTQHHSVVMCRPQVLYRIKMHNLL